VWAECIRSHAIEVAPDDNDAAHAAHAAQLGAFGSQPVFDGKAVSHGGQ
jgi:hypothetical protein